MSRYLVSGEESLWQKDVGENGEMCGCIDGCNKGLLLSAEYSTFVNEYEPIEEVSDNYTAKASKVDQK